MVLLNDEGVHLATSDPTEQVLPVDLDPDALALLDPAVLRIGASSACGIFFTEADEAVGKHVPTR